MNNITRKTKLSLNIASSLLYEITAIICGFVLPRFFLTYYGSRVNGLVSSITQFLGFITLAECGVGAVVQSALYKPLATHDTENISKIVLSSERFFRKIAYVLIGYTAVLMVVYPFVAVDSFDYLYSFVLIFVISISSFAQYYFGMTYKLLLNADQLGFIQNTVSVLALILNTVSCVILMRIGATIQTVKLVTSLIFVIQPVLLSAIAKRRYTIDRSIELTEEPIKQKWNGLAQHISGVVLGNTDVVVLTLLSSLENVSIYAVYSLIVNGVKQIVVSMTNGFRALFGNMLAKDETDTLNDTFDCVEWLLHTLVTFVFLLTAFLIVPFVRVYTKDITDANYIVPTFACLITLAQAAYCLRLPYYVMVNAAGHYKQTQMSAIIEASINIVLSVTLVFRFGLVGVAIGTFAAMTYRTLYLVNYLKKSILFRKMDHFFKHILIDVCEVLIIYLIVNTFPGYFMMNQISFISWTVLAFKLAVMSIVLFAVINGTLYSQTIRKLIKLVRVHKTS